MDNTLLVALTPYLGEVFVTVATFVIGFLGKAAYGVLNAHKNDKNFAFLTSVAEKAVQAAEQLYAEYDGDTKKAFALKYVQSVLDARNIKVDVTEVDAAIEAAVMTEFNFPAAVEPANAPATTDVISSPGEQPVVDVTTPVDETPGLDRAPDSL